jgi:hypothetical protein
MLVLFTSCDVSKQIINTKDISISLSQIDCGSYEVKNHAGTIGYVVKPFIVVIENRESEIARFENLVSSSYKHHYDDFFRIYVFTKDRIGDTILNVSFLKPKLAHSIPNWQCEQQDVLIFVQKNIQMVVE